jgi:hypothetical protein
MVNKTTVQVALTHFLDASGVDLDAPIKFGPKIKVEPGITQQQRQRLLDDLTKAQQGSRTIIWLWVALIIGIFAIAAGFAVYYRHDQKFVAGSILGGSGIMVVLLHQVRRLHVNQLSSQILLALLPNLPPEHWIKVAMIFAQEIIKPSK